jgi:hypothetical protein
MTYLTDFQVNEIAGALLSINEDKTWFTLQENNFYQLFNKEDLKIVLLEKKTNHKHTIRYSDLIKGLELLRHMNVDSFSNIMLSQFDFFSLNDLIQLTVFTYFKY